MSILFALIAPIPRFFSSIVVPAFGTSSELVILAPIVVAMGIADWIWGGDDSETSVTADEPGGDDLFEDEGETGEFGELDGMDDWEDSELGEMSEAGTDASELEPRIEDLEGELDSVSSTMSTVRSENEEIAESVQDMEENIRKLLEIYEMVTRGVNPFVDDVQQSGGFDGETFELFESESDDSQKNEELDSDIVSADAESFFDEDFAEDESMAEFDPSEDVTGEQTDDAPNEDNGVPSGSEQSGMTFEELKEEYESGSGEWGDADGSDGAGNETVFERDDSNVHEGHQSGSELDDNEGREGEEEQNHATDIDEGASDTSSDEFSEPESSNAGDDESRAAEPEKASTAAGDRQHESDEKPYLETLPAGYSAELLVMEWLEYLHSESDLAQTHAAIEYYENMEWISESVATELATVLAGMPSAERSTEAEARARADGAGCRELGIEHHTTSLKYISRLTGGQFRPSSFQIGSKREE